MTTTWKKMVCVHGIEEGLDAHDCIECQDIARECDFDMSKGKTYIFTSQQQITNLKTNVKK